ncbi:MAG TPA: hypothetical protein VGJ38_11030 [Jatrophihabitantaceae bacterium]|jgi:nucleoid-associated protein YgaU
MTAQAIERVMLTGSDGTDLACQFNPSALTLSKGTTWNTSPTRGSSRQPRPQFVGTGPELLTASLLFDGFDTERKSKKSVEQAIEQLIDWTCVPPSSYEGGTPQPPTVTFRWGTGVSFEGFLKSVNAQYTMFAPDGRPLRATADITLQRVPDDPKPTNPTSGGATGRKSAVLGDGDSLASIAYQHYGDPNLWRAIAIANGVDDPRRIATGTRLLVPPRAEAVTASAAGGPDA